MDFLSLLKQLTIVPDKIEIHNRREKNLARDEKSPGKLVSITGVNFFYPVIETSLSFECIPVSEAFFDAIDTPPLKIPKD